MRSCTTEFHEQEKNSNEREGSFAYSMRACNNMNTEWESALAK